MIVLDVSTRWQSWVESNFSLDKNICEVYTVKFMTYVSLSYSVVSLLYFVLYMDEYIYSPKPPFPLNGFFKHIL